MKANRWGHLVPPLYQMRSTMLDTAALWEDKLNDIHPSQRSSAANLLHYLAMRAEDLRDIQNELHAAGLSSLASSESHALRQVEAVLERLGETLPENEISKIDFLYSGKLMNQRANVLFGPKVNPNIPHLMVTMDTAMADDYAGVKNLLLAGMNIARINCAHDDESTWLRMVQNIKKASRASGHPCKIYLDLAGPKLRIALPSKGRKKGAMKISEKEIFYMVEPDSLVASRQKMVACTLPGVIACLQPGDRVLFDDGLFEAAVLSIDDDIATLEMLRISGEKNKLKNGKGINFPDTALDTWSLTAYDKSVIPFAHTHADIVGFSFVRKPEDVAELQSLLKRPKRKPIPIVLKIETYDAAQNLPGLLLQGMKEPLFGVMIARGDLAVEIGFERLSEIQEEILWLSEAAHAPVIWATQVLESLNKSGLATRSELTDAAYATHAECVMLNKGKHLLLVLAALRNILHRSGGHHLKKRYVFRPLGIAERFINSR